MHVNCQSHFYLCNRGPYVRLAFMPNMLSSWNKDIVINYLLNAQWRHWSYWADAQADLSLRWAHRLFYWFCHVQAQMKKSEWVTVTRHSTWLLEVNRISSNAYKSLAFIKRNIKTKHACVREAAYKTTVRPQLEYVTHSPFVKFILLWTFTNTPHPPLPAPPRLWCNGTSYQPMFYAAYSASIQCGRQVSWPPVTLDITYLF